MTQVEGRAHRPLLVICRSLDRMAGGVEHMATELMNAMVARGHDVHLLSWDEGTPEPFFDLSPQIRWHRLDLGAPDQKADTALRLRRASAIRRICRTVRPGVAVCFQHSNFLFARLSALALPIKFIAAERNAPTRFDHSSEGRQKEFIFQSFRLASRVVVQFDEYIELYPAYLRSKMVAISNPVLPANSAVSKDRTHGDDEKVLLAVGRLSYQKNFASLIESFARLAADYPQWRLVIAGDGEEKEGLMAMVRAHELEGRVSFLGQQSDMASLYAKADLFCLPSRWEGFPNALAEALANGLPSVGFAQCAGVNGLIREGSNGLLAPGNGCSDSLAHALGELMASSTDRAKMGDAARKIVDRYKPNDVFDRWERLFGELL